MNTDIFTMEQRSFAQFSSKKNIIRFLEENPELFIVPRSHTSCPIAQYLRFNNALYNDFTPVVGLTKIKIHAGDTIKQFTTSLWQRKFIQFIDQLHGSIQAKDIIQRVKEL